MIFRLAVEDDLNALAQMRWDFRIEEAPNEAQADQATFVAACAMRLREYLQSGKWGFWLADEGGEIVAHMFVQRIDKIPRPNYFDSAMGYLTNVYTKPRWRDQGIGGELMRHALSWARDQKLEEIVCWPSSDSLRFYQRAGFKRIGDGYSLALK